MTKRGRGADKPSDIPIAGWLDIATRIRLELGRDRVALVAAGVGFFALLAAFPALAAAVSLIGLFASPDTVSGLTDALAGVFPPDVVVIVEEQLQSLAARQNSDLGLAALIGFVTAMWSARRGTVAVLKATNLAYEEEDKRPFLRALWLSIVFTLGSVGYFAAVIVFAVGLPVLLSSVIDTTRLVWAATVLQYVMFWFFAAAGLTLLYRFAPDRRRPQWRWVTWGAGVGAALWIAGSAALAVYAASFASFQETYGSLAGVVVVMLWLYLGGYAVLLGAEINAEIEHQTAVDTTVGEQRPLGERGAYVADHLGPARDEL